MVQKESAFTRRVNLADLALAMLQHKTLIFVMTMLGTLGGILYALLATPIYKSEAAFIPPSDDQGVASTMLAQFGGLADMAGGSLGLKDPSQMYMGILLSKTIRKEVIQDFHLDQVYRIPDPDDLLLALAAHTDVSVGKDEIIRVDVYDESPQRAADIANAYLQHMRDRINKFRIDEANTRRIFYEDQLHSVKENLASAEITLMSTQQKSGLINPEGQAAATLTSIAEMRAQLSVKQVELSAMAKSMSPSNPDVIRAKAEFEEISKQVQMLNKGSAPDVLLHMSNLPQASVDYIRNLREVKYQEALFEILAKQLEMARMDENRKSTDVKILDHAEPPSKRTSPKRTLVVICSFILSVVLAVLLAYLLSVWNALLALKRAEFQVYAEEYQVPKFLRKLLSLQ